MFDNLVTAEDQYGNIISQKAAGYNDENVIQDAINAAGPASEVKLLKGKYILNRSLIISNNIKVVGEGRETLIVPPIDDFAFKIITNENTVYPRPFYEKEGFPVYAVVLRDLAIDGEREGISNSGKGLYLRKF